MLATRGALGADGRATVKLPNVRFAAGNYQFAVWLVAQVDPGSVNITRSPAVEAG